jgi:hypothetical protein
MKKQINDLLFKMQLGENCIGETANALLLLFRVSSTLNDSFKVGDKVNFKEYKNATVVEVFKNGMIDIETDDDYIYIKLEDMKYVTKSV